MRDDSAVRAHSGARARWTMLGMMASVLGMFLPLVVVGATTVEAAGSCGGDTLASFCVEDSTTLAPIATYKWLVNRDDTGDPTFNDASVATCLPARAAVNAPPGYAAAAGGNLDDCPWPSVRAVPGNSPVVASGTNADKDRLAQLPAGRYLISVTARDYKIDGVHFEVAGGLVSVNDEPISSPTVDFAVRMNPMPKLTATVRVHVFNDNASTNGQWDGQTETLLTCADPIDEPLPAGCNGVIDANLVADPNTDMSGFTVSIKDVLADVTTDVFGNPLCTAYVMVPATDTEPARVYLDEYGSPVPLTFGSTLAGTESSCISDHYGDIVIPNLGPNRYAASVIAPDARTHSDEQWVQTTTLEGGHDWDTWNMEGGSGYDTELIVGGERVSPVAHGFVKLSY
ncbi:MAG: hypothetical protein WCC60_07625, partial [Ilumatobacteraceae bacterium]